MDWRTIPPRPTNPAREKFMRRKTVTPSPRGEGRSEGEEPALHETELQTAWALAFRFRRVPAGTMLLKPN